MLTSCDALRCGRTRVQYDQVCQTITKGKDEVVSMSTKLGCTYYTCNAKRTTKLYDNSLELSRK